MVKRDELKQKIKEKILFIGETGVGKTYAAVKIAEYVAQHGKQVVFLDPEFGAERELELLSDEVLENIELRVVPDWGSLKKAVWSEDQCFLKVVDGLSEAFVSDKIYLEDRFASHGKYMVGESEVEIKDKEVFSLPWQSYSKVYDTVRKVVHELVKQKPHIICTMHSFGATKTKEKLESDVFRKFDTIMELRRVTSSIPTPSIKYEAVLKKHRGRPFIAYVVFEDYIGQLKKLFGRRMGVED